MNEPESLTVTFAIPPWARDFGFVKDVLRRSSSHGIIAKVQDDALQVCFESDELAHDGSPAAWQEFEQLLGRAKIPYDRVTEEDSDVSARRYEKRRWQVTGQGERRDFSQTLAQWSDEEEYVSIDTLNRWLKDEKGPAMLAQAVQARARTCGRHLAPVRSIPRPQDDVMFSMALNAVDADLVKRLSHKDLANQPYVGSDGMRPLTKQVLSGSVEMAAILLEVGADPSLSCSRLDVRSIEQLALDASCDIEPSMRQLLQGAVSRRAALAAIDDLNDYPMREMHPARV